MHAPHALRPSSLSALLRARPGRGRAALPLAALALALGACSDQASEASGPSGSSEETGEASLDVPSVASLNAPARDAALRLIEAVTPLSSDASLAETNEWHRMRKLTLEELRAGGPEIGEAAWAYYHEDPDRHVDIRQSLLDVASHNVPERTEGHLVELVETFGPPLLLRRKAAELLALTRPERAARLLEPILLRRGRQKTYPPEDKMLEALLVAKRALGEESGELLASVATDLTQFEEARHYAIRALKGTTSERGRAALRQLLVESGPNSYLRRLAAQSLQGTLPSEELCPLLDEVFAREADPTFQVFLMSLRDANCK